MKDFGQSWMIFLKGNYKIRFDLEVEDVATLQ
jgi:hypothetical protein